MLKLIINPDTESSWELPLPPGSHILGSDPSKASLHIDHPSVAPQHCEIIAESDAAHLSDLASGMGSLVEGQAVTEQIINPGQRLQIGAILMRLESVSELIQPSRSSAGPAPAATAQAAVEPMNCRYHPKSPAGNYCSKCQRGYCSLCINQRGGENFCRACGGTCTPLEAVAPSEIVEASFYRQIPGTFAYPFKGNGIFMMAIGSILFVLINFASQFSFLIWVLMIGYAALYAQGIIQASAQGDGRGPEWPDLGGSVRTALFVACFQYIATIVLCFLPLFLLMFFADETQTWVGFGIPGFIAMGFIYLPMALLAVGIFDSVVAVNPTVVLPALFRAPAAYVTTLVLQGLLIGLAAGLEMLISMALPFPFLPGLVSSAFSLYFLTVSVRLLGVFYHSNRYQIGWVNHS